MGALVLTRKVGESFVIGDDITVTVVAVGGGTARLAIRAPDEVKIWREEIAPAEVVPVQVDNGVCPHCDSEDVTRADPLADTYRCGSCRAAWHGLRRKLAA